MPSFVDWLRSQGYPVSVDPDDGSLYVGDPNGEGRINDLTGLQAQFAQSQIAPTSSFSPQSFDAFRSAHPEAFYGDDPTFNAEQVYKQQLAQNGYIPLNFNGQSGMFGLDDSAIQRSPTAQAIGLRNLNDYLAYEYGPGQNITADGQQFYKPDTFTYSGTSEGLTPAHPFDLGLSSADPIGNLVLTGLMMAAVPAVGAGIGAAAGIPGAIGNIAASSGLSALTGGDPITAAITAGAGNLLPNVSGVAPLDNALKSAAGAAATGGDPTSAALMSALTTGATQAGNAITNAVGNLSGSTQTADAGPFTYSASMSGYDPSLQIGGGLDIGVTPVTPDPISGALPTDMSTSAGPVLFPTSIDMGGYDPSLNLNLSPTISAGGLDPTLTLNQPAEAGGNNVPFFPDIIGSGETFDPYAFNTTLGNVGTTAFDPSSLDFSTPSVFQSPEDTINPDYFNPTTASGAGVSAGGVLGLIRSLLGTGSGPASNLLGNGGILGTGLTLNNAAAIAPSLAAIEYARNQSPFDTSSLQGLSSQIPTSFNFDTSGINNVMNQVPTNFSVDTSPLTSLQSQIPTSFDFDTSKLQDAYSAFDPNSVTGQYDLNTAQARNALASSLAQRGVTGSSFANADFANFNQQRDVGRQQLINNAIAQREGIAKDILNSQQSAATLGLQGLGLRNQIANNLINAQQTANSQNIQGLGLRGNLANAALDNQYRSAALGLQGQGLQRNIFGDILNANIASQKNKNDLYGRALLALSGGSKPSGPYGV